ncbi:hypothetical protein S40288_11147 [Stachybotrys chartarum IBT 40288]|nr:hypothetical protein S40288_11147 [Stachybotrys chartarum IBT 40288]
MSMGTPVFAHPEGCKDPPRDDRLNLQCARSDLRRTHSVVLVALCFPGDDATVTHPAGQYEVKASQPSRRRARSPPTSSIAAEGSSVRTRRAPVPQYARPPDPSYPWDVRK